MTEVVPAEIDPLELLPIPRRALPRRPRLDAVGNQSKRFPGRLELRLVSRAFVPDQQHLAAPATALQHDDDAVVQQRSHLLMLRRVHLLQRRVEQLLLLVSREPPVACCLRLLVHADAESIERRLADR